MVCFVFATNESWQIRNFAILLSYFTTICFSLAFSGTFVPRTNPDCIIQIPCLRNRFRFGNKVAHIALHSLASLPLPSVLFCSALFLSVLCCPPPLRFPSLPFPFVPLSSLPFITVDDVYGGHPLYTIDQKNENGGARFKQRAVVSETDGSFAKIRASAERRSKKKNIRVLLTAQNERALTFP